jgi:2-polyprenyl-3-methyl-5-hydroxy-6-metoxy-1,4-benzoquinol methylase
MNTFWSDYIQSTEELYESRSLRFRADNASVWLPFLHIPDKENGKAKILEIGSAGGALLHSIYNRTKTSIKARWASCSLVWTDKIRPKQRKLEACFGKRTRIV